MYFYRLYFVFVGAARRRSAGLLPVLTSAL